MRSARDGEPLRMMPGAVELMVAPNWIWILGFTLLGILAGARHAALRTRPSPGR